MKLTKVYSGPQFNKRNFTLLGDPALKLAYPKQNIITDSINGNSISDFNDTLKALSIVEISGYVTDLKGDKIPGFNGKIYPVVYDKKTIMSTLGNDGTSKMNFSKLPLVSQEKRIVGRDSGSNL